MLKIRENGFLGHRLGARRQGTAVHADFFFRRFRNLAQVVSRSLQVFSQALDRVQAQDLDQRLPLFRLRLVDEVRERTSTQEERFAPKRSEQVRRALVGEHDLSPERAAGEHLHRRDAVAIAADIAHRVLASFVRQQLDVAREVPLERVSNGALPGAIVAVHDGAFALAEIDRHFTRDATERVHHQAVELLIHWRHPRTADGSPRIGRRRPSSTPRQDAGQIRRELIQRFEQRQKKLLRAWTVHRVLVWNDVRTDLREYVERRLGVNPSGQSTMLWTTGGHATIVAAVDGSPNLRSVPVRADAIAQRPPSSPS